MLDPTYGIWVFVGWVERSDTQQFISQYQCLLLILFYSILMLINIKCYNLQFLLGVASSTQPTVSFIFVGWVERSDTQHLYKNKLIKTK